MHTHRKIKKEECLYPSGSSQATVPSWGVGRASILSAMGRLVDLVAGGGGGYSLFAFIFFAELFCEAGGMIICRR